RIEHQPGAAAGIADHLQGTIDVAGRFRMEGDEAGAGGGEIGDQAIDRLDHQVHVDRDGNVAAHRLADHRPDRQVRDVMVVHDVEVNQVGAGGLDRAHLLAEPGEIGG